MATNFGRSGSILGAGVLLLTAVGCSAGATSEEQGAELGTETQAIDAFCQGWCEDIYWNYSLSCESSDLPGRSANSWCYQQADMILANCLDTCWEEPEWEEPPIYVPPPRPALPAYCTDSTAAPRPPTWRAVYLFCDPEYKEWCDGWCDACVTSDSVYTTCKGNCALDYCPQRPPPSGPVAAYCYDVRLTPPPPRRPVRYGCDLDYQTWCQNWCAECTKDQDVRTRKDCNTDCRETYCNGSEPPPLNRLQEDAYDFMRVPLCFRQHAADCQDYCNSLPEDEQNDGCFEGCYGQMCPND